MPDTSLESPGSPGPPSPGNSSCTRRSASGKPPRFRNASLLKPPIPSRAIAPALAPQLYGSARSLARWPKPLKSDSTPLLVIARDARELDQLRAELAFFLGDARPIHVLPGLGSAALRPALSPHPDIISERLAALAELPRLKSAVSAGGGRHARVSALAPRGYVDGRTFNLAVGDKLPIEPLRARLVEIGYASVSQVSAPGEFALRGSLFDVFPMGADDAAARRPVRRRDRGDPRVRSGHAALRRRR